MSKSTLENEFELGLLSKVAHSNFCARCLNGLPATMAEADPSRVAFGYYCLGALDILGLLDSKLTTDDREAWHEWIWAQQVRRPGNRRHRGAVTPRNAGPDASFSRTDEVEVDDSHIGGFRPGPFMDVGDVRSDTQSLGTIDIDTDPPHLIMTYTALLALAILRDDFTQLDRQGLINLLRATQLPDGSFSPFPGEGEADMRMVYTAFAISAMLDDWRGVDVPRAIAFAKRCASYEGGFGQAPGNEAQGGPTYCVLATLALAPAPHREEARLNREERRKAERWLVQQQHARRVFVQPRVEDEEDEDGEGSNIGGNGGIGGGLQEEGGGFAGRTEKGADACYSFWCGAALRILRSGAVGGGDTRHPAHATTTNVNGVKQDQTSTGRPREVQDQEPEQDGKAIDVIDRRTHARFLSRCQFRLGGLAKAPGAHPDPYHTYLALAAIALYPPYPPRFSLSSEQREGETQIGERQRTRNMKEEESWRVAELDPLINATEETARWARERISGKR